MTITAFVGYSTTRRTGGWYVDHQLLTSWEKKRLQKYIEEAGDPEVGVKAFMRWKCLTDLFFLGYEVLGLKHARHNKVPLIYPPLHRSMAQALQAEGSKMLIYPRDTMKTTWTKIYIIQCILNDPNNVRIAYVSQTAGLGRKGLKSIVQMLMSPALMELFPDVIPPTGKLSKGMPTKWAKVTDDVFLMKRDVEEGTSPQEFQLEVAGIEMTLTGSHYTHQIYDDPIDQQTVRSPTQMGKAEDFIRFAINLLIPGGIEVYIGTPYHYADLIAHCIQEGYFEKVHKRAILENGKSIYPTVFTMKEIEKRRKRMGNYIFSCQLMCDPLPKEDLLFPPPQPMYVILPPGSYDYYVAVDPAATVQVYSDFTAFAVAAVDSIGRLWVEDAFQIKKAGEELATIILQLNEKYTPKQIGVEAGLQAHLMSVVRLLKANWEAAQNRKIMLPIVEIVVSTRAKYDRINMTIGSWLRLGRLKVKESLHDLMSQMEKINPNYTGHDDMVDALSLIFNLVPSFAFKSNATVGTNVAMFRTVEERMKRMRPVTSFAGRFAV